MKVSLFCRTSPNESKYPALDQSCCRDFSVKSYRTSYGSSNFRPTFSPCTSARGVSSSDVLLSILCSTSTGCVPFSSRTSPATSFLMFRLLPNNHIPSATPSPNTIGSPRPIPTPSPMSRCRLSGRALGFGRAPELEFLDAAIEAAVRLRGITTALCALAAKQQFVVSPQHHFSEVAVPSQGVS